MADALRRRIGLGLLTAYGVGVMVGAGIYVLVGAVVADAGVWAPVSFLLAGLIAAPTALSYAEFSARLPEAGGPAAFVSRAFGANWIGVIVGFGIVAAGTVSAAAVLRGGAGYLVSITDLSVLLVVVAMGGAIVAVAVIGVLESLALAALLTAIEVGGLALVIFAGATATPSADFAVPMPIVWPGIAAGILLAFFAFIGFEDIVNMAEEVIAPERTIPRAILLALVITSALYALVTYAAVRAVPVDRLSVSEQPLALVWSEVRGGNAAVLSLIAVAAALNGVLAQIVMAARVMFGMGKRTAWLRVFHRAHPRFRTPALATLIIGAVVIAGALTLDVADLAGVTSTILLAVFAVVNLALIVQKRHAPQAPFRVPVAVPVFGLGASLLALVSLFIPIGAGS